MVILEQYSVNTLVFGIKLLERLSNPYYLLSFVKEQTDKVSNIVIYPTSEDERSTQFQIVINGTPSDITLPTGDYDLYLYEIASVPQFPDSVDTSNLNLLYDGLARILPDPSNDVVLDHQQQIVVLRK